MNPNTITLPQQARPINQSTQRKGGGEIQGTKWKDPHLRRQKNHIKRENHKGNIKFSNPLLSQEAYKKGKRRTSWKDT